MVTSHFHTQLLYRWLSTNLHVPQCWLTPWWQHQMETFSALLARCVRNSPVTGEFPAQSPVALSFDVFFDLRLNKRLGKQSWGWWFETPLCSLWRHCNALRRRQMSVMASRITDRSSVCSVVSSNCNKESSKVPVTVPLWGESTGGRWIPRTKEQ